MNSNEQRHLTIIFIGMGLCLLLIAVVGIAISL